MNIKDIKRNRKVLPRWRRFKQTLATSELASLKYQDLRQEELPVSFSEDEFNRIVDDWQQNKTISYAIDLVSAAFANKKNEAAVDAAEFILQNEKNSSSLLHQLARTVKGEINQKSISSNLSDCIQIDQVQEKYRNELRVLRGIIRMNPKDAISWADMSFLYALSGLDNQARKTMECAISLFPENRYLLRACARLYLHIGEAERAYKLLSQSNSVKNDPWVLAAQTAISDLLEKPMRFQKNAKWMLNDNNYSPLQISELACSMGTRELIAGSNKIAKRLFSQAVINPTENSLAQIYWMMFQNSGIGVSSLPNNDFLQRHNSYEAYTYSMAKDKQWESSVEGSLSWLCDQPLSKTPAILGSFIAATYVEDFHLSKKIAQFGLIANECDPTLLNNLAFAQLNMNEVDLARQTLNRINANLIPDASRISVIATHGLLKYHENQVIPGRQKYLEAIKLANSMKNKQNEAMAAIYMAKADIKFNPEMAHESCELAIKLTTQSGEELLEELLVNFKIISQLNK